MRIKRNYIVSKKKKKKICRPAFGGSSAWSALCPPPVSVDPGISRGSVYRGSRILSPSLPPPTPPLRRLSDAL